MGTKPPLKNGNGSKNMNLNGNHNDLSPTLIRDIIQVNVFSMKHLVEMSADFSADGQYRKAITSLCTKLQMQCMCISMHLVLCLCTGSVEIFISLRLSHQMNVGQVPEEYLATTHIVQLCSLLLYSRPQPKLGRWCVFSFFTNIWDLVLA